LAHSAAALPFWQAEQIPCQSTPNFFANRLIPSLDIADTNGIMHISPKGTLTMKTVFTLDTINSILLAHSVESAGMAEPLDEMHPMEAAELMGLADELFDEIYPLADDYPEAEWITTG
jgi:hypothetical protein